MVAQRAAPTQRGCISPTSIRSSGAARLVGIRTKIGCYSFRATGTTSYLKNYGRLEVAQQMAGHETCRTTGLYDRRGEEISLDVVERISY